MARTIHRRAAWAKFEAPCGIPSGCLCEKNCVLLRLAGPNQVLVLSEIVSLSKNGFLAIAAVAWADGLVRKNEAEGLLRAARDSGLTADALAEVEAAATSGVDLTTLDLSELSGAERALTYAMAMWLAKVDGVVNTEELKTLRVLGQRLDLPEPKLKAAASAALDVACLPGGNRPDKFEFAALETRLSEKLPALMMRSEPPAPT